MWWCITTAPDSLACVDVDVLLLHLFLRQTNVSGKGKGVVPSCSCSLDASYYEINSKFPNRKRLKL